LQARVWRALAAVTATATVVNAGQELRCAAAFGVRVRRAEAKTLRRGKERHQADATAKHDNDARQLERGGDGRAQRTHDAPHERRAAFIRIARIHILLFYGLYFFLLDRRPRDVRCGRAGRGHVPVKLCLLKAGRRARSFRFLPQALLVRSLTHIQDAHDKRGAETRQAYPENHAWATQDSKHVPHTAALPLACLRRHLHLIFHVGHFY
jgi:hypothetical protein